MTTENQRLDEMKAVVRSSRRFENGVEIVDRELHEVIKVVDSCYITEKDRPSAPRLVISDEGPSGSNFIARRRSDIEGLE
ncbi:MAG: hypothetical protein ABI539_15635, partial [Acidobacteriota bacterium]